MKGQKYNMTHDSLEEAMISMEKPKLSSVNKDEMRQYILQRVQQKKSPQYVPIGLRRLSEMLNKKGREVTVPAWASVILKERLLDYIEDSAVLKRSIFPEMGFGMLRTVTAGFLLFVFAVTTVVVLPFQSTVTYAKSTYLGDLSGEVLVVRNSNVIKAKTDMFLKEGDTVITSEESSVTIHYFDDSVSRLGENTTVEMKTLYTEPLDPLVTNVEVFVDDGRVWTKVLTLSDDSTFMVDTVVIHADVQKKAAFDLQIKDNATEVAVYDNVVEITSNKADADTSKTVIAGYKVEISGESVEDAIIEKLPKSIINSFPDEDSIWVAENLDSDTKYEKLLIVDKEEIIESNESEELLASATDSLNMDIVILDEEAEELKQDFIESYKVLVRAEAQLVRGAHKEGADGLKQFKKLSLLAIESLPQLEASNEIYSEVLRDFMKGKIAVQLNDFASFLPGDRLYRAKEVLHEIDLALAASDIERVEIQLSQAEGSLFEMQELLENGKPNLASTLLKRYQNRTNGSTLALTDENLREFQDKFYSLVERQVQQMKILTSIEKSIVYRDQFDFRDKVRGVREDILRKFIIALEQMPHQFPEGLMLDVKELYDVYVDEGDGIEDDLIDPAFEKLSENDYQISFIRPGGEEFTDLGIVEMVVFDASKEVEDVRE